MQRKDCETQTEAVDMDISESPSPSPSPHCASRQFLPSPAIEEPRASKQVSRASSPGGGSLNGNTLQESESEPAMYDDANSNLAPETDHHLETLNRKVSEILNGNRERLEDKGRKRGHGELKVPSRRRMVDSSDTLESQESNGSSREDLCDEWSEDDGSVYKDKFAFGRRR